MSLIDTLHQNLFPVDYSKKKVQAQLDELEAQPRVGDPVIQDKLEQLNKDRQVYNVDALTAAYVKGLNQENFAPNPEYQVQDAIDKRQTGVAQELAKVAMADGVLSADERTALQDIAAPHYENRHLSRLPGAIESYGLENLLKAPN